MMGLNIASVQTNSLLSVVAPAVGAHPISEGGSFAARMLESGKAIAGSIIPSITNPMKTSLPAGASKLALQASGSVTETAAGDIVSAVIKTVPDVATEATGQAKLPRGDKSQSVVDTSEIEGLRTNGPAMVTEKVAAKGVEDPGEVQRAVLSSSADRASVVTPATKVATGSAIAVPVRTRDTKLITYLQAAKNPTKNSSVDETTADASDVKAVGKAVALPVPVAPAQAPDQSAARDDASASVLALAAPALPVSVETLQVPAVTVTQSKGEGSTTKHASSSGKAQSVTTDGYEPSSQGVAVAIVSGLNVAAATVVPVAIQQGSQDVHHPASLPVANIRPATLGGVNATSGKKSQDAVGPLKAETVDSSASASSVSAAIGFPRNPLDSSVGTTVSTEAGAAGGTISLQGMGAGPTAVAAAHTGSPSTSIAGSDQAALQSSTRQASENSDYQTLVATPNVLEVGLSSGSHGWLRVRAELEPSSGEVAASVITSSSASAQTLHQQVPAIAAYLASEQIGVSSVSVGHAVSSGGSANLSFNGNGGQQQNAGGQQQSKPSSNLPDSGSDWTVTSDVVPGAAVSTDLYRPAGGSWLSVRA